MSSRETTCYPMLSLVYFNGIVPLLIFGMVAFAQCKVIVQLEFYVIVAAVMIMWAFGLARALHGPLYCSCGNHFLEKIGDYASIQSKVAMRFVICSIAFWLTVLSLHKSGAFPLMPPEMLVTILCFQWALIIFGILKTSGALCTE